MRILVLAAALALSTGSAMAQVALPLAAPENTYPLLADFVDVCSLSLRDPSAAATLAGERGWSAAEDDAAMRMAAAAFGNLTFTLDVEDDTALLLIQRAMFPHLVASSCTIQLFRGVPAGLDMTALSDIPGVEGGLLPIPETRDAGRWSFVDDADEVVAITSFPAGGEGIILSMSRAERVDGTP